LHFGKTNIIFDQYPIIPMNKPTARYILLVLVILLPFLGFSQLRISVMNEYPYGADSFYFPAVPYKGAANFKVLGKFIGYGKVDSLWQSGGHLYYRRWGNTQDAGTINGGGGTGNVFPTYTVKQWYNGYGNFINTNTDSIGIEGATNLWFTQARVRTTPITGFASGAGTLSATDNILQAIQKLDGNIGVNTTAIAGKQPQLSGTGFVKATGTTISYDNSTYVPTSTTVNGKALSGNITLGLASSDFANQGTTTTVLHGNGSGNPVFSSIGTSDVASNAISNALLGQMPANTFKANNTGSTANATDITVAQAKTLLGYTLASSDFANQGTTTTVLHGNGSGNPSFSSIGTNDVASNAITNALLGQMAAHTYKGNNTGSTANAADITSTQLTADLNLFTSSLQGLVPSSGGGTTNFLRADGTWAAPAGGGGAVSSVSNADGTLTISPTTGAVLAQINLTNANSWTGAQHFGGSYTTTANFQKFSIYNPSVTARGTASDLFSALNIVPTLTAGANNQIGIGVRINPTYTNGAFTGVTNWGLQVPSIVGDTASGGDLVLSSTTHATKHRIYFNAAKTAFFDEVNSILNLSINGSLAIGNTSVSSTSLIFSDWNATFGFSAANSKLQMINGNGDGLKMTGSGVFQTNGFFAAINATAKTANYTAVLSDYTIRGDATGGAITITLPTAVGIQGQIYIIKKTDGSANAVTVATTSSQNIRGTSASTTYSLPTVGKYVMVQSNNVDWDVIGNN
jgi:hypothetical protein